MLKWVFLFKVKNMKNLYFALILAAAGALISPFASAGEATFCKGQNTYGSAGDDALVFTCGGGLKGTLPQLAKMGWSVVSFQIFQGKDVNDSGSYGVLVLQKP
jgi:hypothetical protein